MSSTLVIAALMFVANDNPNPKSNENPRRTPVVQVVERAGPAVVNIATETRAQRNPFRGQRRDDFFERFFSEAPRRGDSQHSLGSGVIIDKSGLVLTNEHVISHATNITITLSDRRVFEVDVVGADPAFDIAVLKVRNAKDLPAVEIGTSGDLMPGEPVVAIGNPFGLSNSVTTGVVSALHRSIEASGKNYEDFVQTDAAINPGNSGGALLSIEGKLIGINTAIYSSANGIGFAIPVDQAMAVVDEVLRYGEVRAGFTGIFVDPSSTNGARVSHILEKSPSAASGLRVGDVIVDVGGTEIRNAHAFRSIERSTIPGREVRITAARGPRRTPHVIKFRAGELKREMAVQIGRGRLGLEVQEQNGRLVVSRVGDKSSAAEIGVKRGDLLLSAGGRRLRTRADFEDVCAAVYDAQAITVVVGRRGRAYYVNLELDSRAG